MGATHVKRGKRSTTGIPATFRRRDDAGVRLDPTAWILSGLDVLAEQGVDAVRVEVLAKRLSVTKGSFYWHFRDRAALLDEMLESWRRRATLAIIERIDHSAHEASMRLQTLLELPFAGAGADRGADVELAIRLWGRRDARARAVLGEVDELRLRYFVRLLEGAGKRGHDARARALLAYSYMRVANSLPEGAEALPAILRLLLKP
jgi:AcrR family transcriptional regulator